MLTGYVRVSTNDQNTDLQRNALNCAGCERIFEDKISGTKSDRLGLKKLLRTLSAGDTLVVWKLDRLGRSMRHLVTLIEELRQRGVNFRSLTDSIDTSTPMGRFFFHVMGALAEMERELIVERTSAELAAARAKGRVGGRRPKLTTEQWAQIGRLSGLLGALLSPIGLVVTALAGVALVVWKYWQPITAFLGGVVEGFKAAAGPISAAFEPLKPVFQWIGDKVQALWGWFTDLLTPVKSTSAELQSAAAMGRRFGEALAEGLNMVMHPLDSLKSGVSWLLEKLGIVSKEAAKAKLPESVTRQQPATVNADGKVMMPSGDFPSWGYGFAGMYDSGGYIPRGQFGIVGENGPEIVNGPANVTSRRNTAALAAVVAGMMGVAAAPAELPPLHPLALPAKGGEAMVSRAATVPPIYRIEAPTQIIIQTQPGQSAQDIAREVARQLDERERRLKAKARSNYSDQGGIRRMMMVLGLYVFMLRTVPYQELQYQRSWRHAANSRVNRRPSTQFLGPDNDMLTLSGVLMPEITGGRLSLLALEQMAEQGKAWPLIEGSGTIYGMYVIEGLNQTKTEFFRDGMPRRIEFTLSLKRVDESLSDIFGDLSAQLNNLQDTATSALSDISKTVGGLLS